MTHRPRTHRDLPPRLIDDGYLDEPLDERVPAHPALPARRPGCSVLPWLVLAVVVWRVGL